MSAFRTLNAWQHAQRLAVECGKIARGFPPYEQDALADELRRCAYRAPIRIADGAVRRDSRDCRPSLESAYAALAEVETILEIARDLGYLDAVTFARISEVATQASKTLYGLVRKIPQPERAAGQAVTRSSRATRT
jgi:four helix bundle protein